MSWYLFPLFTGLSFLFLTVVFRPIEWAFPARMDQRIFRPYWFTDLCFFLGQYLFWSGLVFGLIAEFGGEIHKSMPLSFKETVMMQPLWLQAVEVVILSDLFIYWAHRLQHRVAFLWRFHKVHHSAEHLDWLAAHREHPLDTLYTVTIINLPAFLLGFDARAIAFLLIFRGIWAIYIHSNVRLPIGPLRMLIGAPELHHWHHDKARDAGNYANLSPLMDLLFGTYTCPDHEPEAFGIHEPVPKGYAGQLLEPMLPEPLRKRYLGHLGLIDTHFDPKSSGKEIMIQKGALDVAKSS